MERLAVLSTPTSAPATTVAPASGRGDRSTTGVGPAPTARGPATPVPARVPVTDDADPPGRSPGATGAVAVGTLPEVLVFDEAAALLGWSLKATYAAVCDGQLPAATFGSPHASGWRFKRDALLRYRTPHTCPEHALRSGPGAAAGDSSSGSGELSVAALLPRARRARV